MDESVTLTEDQMELLVQTLINSDLRVENEALRAKVFTMTNADDAPYTAM